MARKSFLEKLLETALSTAEKKNQLLFLPDVATLLTLAIWAMNHEVCPQADKFTKWTTTLFLLSVDNRKTSLYYAPKFTTPVLYQEQT